MAQLNPWTTAVLLLLAICTGVGARKEGPQRMLQSAGNSSTAAPPATTVLLRLHGIGTQNYTAEPNTTYKNIGARADLYNSMKTKVARHFFAAANEPTWVIINPSTGAQEGMVHGKVLARAPTPAQADDGGFGSVDALLTRAFRGQGVLANCTYVQRLNVLGGGAPESLIALPAWNGIPNYEATFSYQADYVFLSGGGPGPAG